VITYTFAQVGVLGESYVQVPENRDLPVSVEPVGLLLWAAFIIY
jgi:hypothetical protein